MAVFFDRPVGLSVRQNNFSDREVGLTHPDTPSFIRLSDNGDIHIMAGEDIGIILSPSKQTIFLVGDCIKLLTKEEGLKWNAHAFNSQATTYSEPSLIPIRDTKAGLYDGINEILD